MADNIQTIPDKVGLKQVSRMVVSGQAAKVLLAEDADAFIQKKVLSLCKEQGIPIERVSSMRELGQLCRISVGAAVAAYSHQP